MNQSLALLYKDPSLAEELHDDIRKTNCHLETARAFTLIDICASVLCLLKRS